MVANIVDELAHPVDGSRVVRVRWQVSPFNDIRKFVHECCFHNTYVQGFRCV